MPYLGNDLSTIVKQGKKVYEYVATAGQTAFTGADSNGESLDITVDSFVSVFLNGIRLIKTDDYTLSTDTVTLVSGASLNDELIIVADIEAATFNTYTKTEADAQLALKANSADVYTQAQVDTEISTAVNGLVNSAPGTLDTLDELAAALNDDANFASTVTTSLNAKAPLASPEFTGALGVNVTSPTYPLDIQHPGGNLNQTPILRVKQGSDGCFNAITLESSTSADKNIGIQFVNQSTVKGGLAYAQSNKLNLYGGSTPQNGLFIDTSNYVSIGNSTPTARLQVGTNANTTNWDDRIIFGGVTASSLDGAFSPNANQRARVWIAGGGEGQASLGFWNGDSGGTGFTISHVGGRMKFANKAGTEKLAVYESASGQADVRVYNNIRATTFIHRTGNSGGIGDNEAEAIYFGGSSAVFHDNVNLSSAGQAIFRMGGSRAELLRMRNNSGYAIYAENGNITSASDHRIKTDVTEIPNAWEKVKQINPIEYRHTDEWDPDNTDKRLTGFIAHELQELIPAAVGGVKDEVDEEGNPVMQGVDYGRVTPLLAAALKEALNKIEELEARIDAAGL